MSFFDDLICPVSNIKIDSHISRVTVFINTCLLGLYIYTGVPYFIAAVALDYGIRAMVNPKYSPIRWICAGVINFGNFSPILIDQAPKLFASRVGFLFASVSALLLFTNAFASLIVAGILIVFTTLDSVFNFCVGCLTYYYIVLPFYQRHGIRDKKEV